MATHHGKEGSVFIEANKIAEVTDWTYDEDASLVESTAINSDSKIYEPGIPDGSGTVNCHYDPSDTTGQALMTVGAKVDLNLYPIGTGQGDNHSGEVVIGTVSRKGGREGLVEATFTFKGKLS